MAVEEVRPGIGAVLGAGRLAVAPTVSAAESAGVTAESAGMAAEGHRARSEGTSPTAESK
jgi:hypothetical protein